MRLSAACCLICALVVLAGCAPPVQPASTAAPSELAQTWLFGVERMRDDPLLLAPYTNRLIADLAALPKVRVISLTSDANAFLFNTVAAPRLRVMTWLRGEGHCLQVSYTVITSGQQIATFGLVVPPLPAGPEPDSACVDRAVTELYRTLVLQGL